MCQVRELSISSINNNCLDETFGNKIKPAERKHMPISSVKSAMLKLFITV